MHGSRPEAGAVLRIVDAHVRYGDRAAIDGVSMALAAGEIYALLGRNGAGKSTLARVAIGHRPLDAGVVRVLGADPTKDRTVRRSIGVAPQEIALYGRLTISENLFTFAAVAGLSRRERSAAVDRVLDQTACAARAHERVERLSGGWRRRANLAAALVHRPRLLVLDEPSEGLDGETRSVLSAILGGLKESGVAVLLISHDALEVAALADRVGVLHQGRLVAEGAPSVLLGQAFGAREELLVRLAGPPDAETAALLGHTGLSALTDPLVWSGSVHGAAPRARALHDVLGARGVGFRELVVRPPSLDQLIAHLTAEAQRAASRQDDRTGPSLDEAT